MKRTPLRRRTPLRKRNARRLRARRDECFGEQAARCEAGRCIACLLLCVEQKGPTFAHHDPSRGAGGKDRDTVGLCEHHHTGNRGVHKLGRETFWRIVGIEFTEVIAMMRRPGFVVKAEPADNMDVSPLLAWLE